MRKVRSDVMNKLDELFKEQTINNHSCGGVHYSTPKADHYLRVIDGKVYYTTIGYDSTRYRYVKCL